MPLPNFVIIGAMKSGTSTLHSNLQLHPEIGMSKFKEPSYFNHQYKNKDIEWYKNLFNREYKVNGESSPNYSKKQTHPGTAERMYKVMPNVKIIYLTREPVNRIKSHLHHNLYRDRLKSSNVKEALRNDRNFILTSSYNYQIEDYLKYFEKSQFLFITTEGLKKNPNYTLNKICDFLEVDNFDFTSKTIPRNQSSDKYLIKYYDQARSILPKKLMKLYHWFFYFLSIKIKRPEFDHETKEFLRSELSSDIAKFRETSGLELKEWDFFKENN